MAPKATHEAPYDLFTHKHNFAAWAAARAVQRGFEGATTEVLESALKNTALKWLNDHLITEFDQARFDDEHRQLCSSLYKALDSNVKVKGVTYGRAAKLLGVYLKTMVVIGGVAPQLAGVIHPPIDAKLLASVALRNALGKEKGRGLSSISWTKLNQKSYEQLIAKLRSVLDTKEPLWALEQYWNPFDK